MTLGKKVLVVGSGGREHALALRLLASDSIAEVLCNPGNGGMSGLPPDLSHKRLSAVAGEPLAIARDVGVDLVVIGPEVPLCEGLADRFNEAGIPCFGPSQRAAEMEGSKATMKAFCNRHGIRTARHVVVTNEADVEAEVNQFPAPPVVKADGLCAGKGVVVAETHQEAIDAARKMLSGEAFGQAGRQVVLEERLLGSEASIHALCDGERALVLAAAQDHKRIFDGDRGPNTGGMGTYAPTPLVDEALMRRIQTEIMDRVVSGMKADGTPFVGALFAGLMVSDSGEPVVLEFNVRFGDPETQVLTMITEGDFGEALLAAAQGRLTPRLLTTGQSHALCVVLASAGYPESSRTGDVITGVDAAEALPGVRVFHAGTRMERGQLVTAGGRVLGITARGSSLQEARDLAYKAAELIQFEGKQLRQDIGYRALAQSPV